MPEPITQWTDSQCLQFFCRHLVALCATIERTNPSEAGQPPRFIACSGTLINIGGVIHFLTAGHILRDLEAALRSDELHVRNAVLADTFGWRRVDDHPIPFDIQNARMLYIDDQDLGLDFGVIPLERYYVRLLAANGVVALGEENWVRQSNVRFDGYVMLGLPEEFTSTLESGGGIVAPTMFAVQRLEAPPDDISPTRHPRFVGQIDSRLPLRSVSGMSGGPIFGFNFDPPSRFWVVALQSSWLPRRRIVFGCPLPILGSLLTEWTANQQAS